MDDLTTALQNVLNNEDSMKQLQDLAQSLGLYAPEESGEPEQSNRATTSSMKVNDLLQELTGDTDGGLPAFTVEDIARLRQLLQSMRRDDPGTALLKSLKPLLHQERRHKVDEAVRLMKLLHLLPLLRDSGMLENLFQG